MLQPAFPDPLSLPLDEIPTADLEALLRIRAGQASIWGHMAANPSLYESPSVPHAPARSRFYRRQIVEITSELDRRRSWRAAS